MSKEAHSEWEERGMNTCLILEWCKCNSAGICLFCKVLTVIGIAAVSGVIGYFIGKKKGKKWPVQSI